MKMKNRMAVLGAAAFALSLAVLPARAADTTRGMAPHQRLGRIEKAGDFIGSDIKDQQNQSVGKIDDAIVDLESGHILYAVASVDGNEVAIAPRSLSPGAGGKTVMVHADKQKVSGAPHVNKDQIDQMSTVEFVNSVYQYWNERPWWEGAAQPTGHTGFGNVHKLSDLKGMQVKNSQNQDLGKVGDAAVDLHAGRILFVVLEPGGTLQKQGDFVYALPPNALTKGEEKTLVTGLDSSKLSAAPKFHEKDWNQVSNPGFASQVYQFYGKQAYFTGGAGLGAAESRDFRNEQRHGLQAGASHGQQGGLGQLEPSNKLIGRDIRDAQNQKIGKLDDLVVDLESGHVIYAVASVDGNKVGVPPQVFSEMGENQPLTINQDKQKVAGAPRFTSDIEHNLASATYASEVYRYFGETPWWEQAGQPTGQAFANAHKASDLKGMSVKSSANESLGKIDSVVVDLSSGRVPFALLGPSGFGAGQALYPIPANALTAGTDQKSLTTGLDKQKLQGAPKVSRNNLRQLSDQAFANSVYEYYGKQPYWGTMAPTGRTGK